MRELETSLQQFGEFILKARLVREKAAPYCVRWVPPIPDAPGPGRAAGGPGTHVLRGVGTREWMYRVAGATGGAGAPHLLRQFPPAN